ncbi:hypothetical protein SDC9_193717 [bioreactor metagenome]|uniref:Uncharacterized protein n=1 Tax=bioreactor metagenome TaxID=1076179 RepID=A0A645ICW3_9ZZZZ
MGVILIAWIDGLSGFTNAIEAVYPNVKAQQMYCPSDSGHYQVCFVQGYQSAHEGSEAHICRYR